jgi:hypothetical protein
MAQPHYCSGFGNQITGNGNWKIENRNWKLGIGKTKNVNRKPDNGKREALNVTVYSPFLLSSDP